MAEIRYTGCFVPVQFLQIEMPEFILDKDSGNWIYQGYKQPCIIGCIQRQVNDKVCTRIIFPDFKSGRRIKCEKDAAAGPGVPDFID